MTSALRLAVRQLRQHPRFVLVTMLVLGLGTGAATTVFSIVDSVVLRPLPYRAPDRLVTLWDTNAEKGLAHDPISPVTFLDYRALPVIADAAAWWRPGVNLVDPGLDPIRVNTVETSANLFRVLGIGPQLGSGFGAGEPLHVRDESLVVISDRLWRTRYAADPGIVGRTLSLSGEPYREWIRELSDALFRGELDEELVYTKRLRRELDAYVKNVPPHVAAARMLGRPMREVSYVQTVRGPEPVSERRSSIDYQHYLEKQLAPAADSVLAFAGERFMRLGGRQLSLF